MAGDRLNWRFKGPALTKQYHPTGWHPDKSYKASALPEKTCAGLWHACAISLKCPYH